MKKAPLSYVFFFSCWMVMAFCGCSSSEGDAKAPVSQPVIFISGGCIDDSVVHMLLLGMDHIDLKGIVLMNADTIYPYAMDSHWKIAQICHRRDVPIGLSRAKGWNPFPYVYRKMSISFNRIPALKDMFPNPDWPPYPSGEQLITKLLQNAIESDQPVVVLITAPITALKSVLAQNRDLEKGIEKVIFMGGAIHVPGNLDPDTIPLEISNQKAEWNIFWDPASTEWVFSNTAFEIVLFPLDVTNLAMVTTGFMEELAVQRLKYHCSAVAFEGYELTQEDPDGYSLWCSTAACYLERPDLYADPEVFEMGVVTEGYEQGALEKRLSGREVKAVLDFKNIDGFYHYVLSLLKR